jgi:hypothetical protein
MVEVHHNQLYLPKPVTVVLGEHVMASAHHLKPFQTAMERSMEMQPNRTLVVVEDGTMTHGRAGLITRAVDQGILPSEANILTLGMFHDRMYEDLETTNLTDEQRVAYLRALAKIENEAELYKQLGLDSDEYQFTRAQYAVLDAVAQQYQKRMHLRPEVSPTESDFHANVYWINTTMQRIVDSVRQGEWDSKGFRDTLYETHELMSPRDGTMADLLTHVDGDDFGAAVVYAGEGHKGIVDELAARGEYATTVIHPEQREGEPFYDAPHIEEVYRRRDFPTTDVYRADYMSLGDASVALARTAIWSWTSRAHQNARAKGKAGARTEQEVRRDVWQSTADFEPTDAERFRRDVENKGAGPALKQVFARGRTKHEPARSVEESRSGAFTLTPNEQHDERSLDRPDAAPTDITFVGTDGHEADMFPRPDHERIRDDREDDRDR